MKKYLSVLKNMNITDWILAILVIALVAYVVNFIFPPNGWMIGIVVSVLLLIIAKHRRDQLTKDK